jgi:tRNA threonylcarbamoyladenosine biosynthesis protein TsaE
MPKRAPERSVRLGSRPPGRALTAVGLNRKKPNGDSPEHYMIRSRFRAESLAALDRIASEFARILRPGDAVAVQGPLGAGKTAFVAAVVRALHGEDQTSSPTFTFWHRYEGAPPIHHLDLYRLESPAELRELGLEQAFAPDALTLVEWAERAPQLLPPGAIAVRIEGVGDGAREIEIARS